MTINPKNKADAEASMRAIAYSIDALIPGLYIWFGSVKIRIGGSDPEVGYPGTINSSAGIALVLPGYRIWSTYQGDYDPIVLASKDDNTTTN